MHESMEGSLLRIYLGEDDKYHGRPLYEAIVLKAREDGLAGATVLRGPMGFGAHSTIHTPKVLRLAENLPVVVEMVDSREKIEQFLGGLEESIGTALVTVERVAVIRFSTQNNV